MAVTTKTVSSGYSTGTINENFQTLEDYINNNLLNRDGTSIGEPNQMEVGLDMNSNFVYNLPEPVLEHQAARLQDVQNAIAGADQANLITFTPYGSISSGNVQGALEEVSDALDQRVIYVNSIADLRALPTSELVDGQAFYVVSGESGIFQWDAASTLPIYDGLVVSSSAGGDGRFIRDYRKINLNDVGGSPANTETENKAVLDNLIAYLDGKAAVIEIDSDIDYGLVRATPATFPDFSTVSDPDTRLAIYDWSLGDADSQNAASRAGVQPRVWYHTGNEEDGIHNGNFEYVYAGWHPGYFISHTGDRAAMAAGMGINRRASVFFATNDVANWRLGQGRVTGDLSEEELAQFVVAANGLPDLGIGGLTSCFVINKTNGNIGFNTGSPSNPYVFSIRPGQSNAYSLAGDSAGGNLRVILDKGDGSTGEIALASNNEVRILAGGSTGLRVFPTGNVKAEKGVGGGAFTTSERNALGSLQAGTMVFDTDLGKPIWKAVTGASAWVDATGATV